MTKAYVKKMGICDSFKESINSFLQGQEGFFEAILASYPEASHRTNHRVFSERGFYNLLKAKEVQ